MKTQKQESFSVTEISQMYGLAKETVREYCRKPWQRFASQPAGKGGKILIDKEKFDRWLANRCTAAE